MAKKAKDDSEAQEKLRPEINELIGRIAAEQKELSRYDEADAALKEAAALNSETAVLETKCKTIHENIRQSDSQLEQYNKFIADTKDTAAELTKLGFTIAEHKKELDRINEIGSEISNVEKLEKAAAAAAKIFESKKSDYYNAEQHSRQLFELYISDQAGVIARTLEQGCPCPVCGSTEHPAPAHTSEKAPDKEAVGAFPVREPGILLRHGIKARIFVSLKRHIRAKRQRLRRFFCGGPSYRKYIVHL